MSYLKIFLLLSVFCFGSAAADVWKWVDVDGNTHFVDTSTAIFTWVEDGKVFYSDTPDHEDAAVVQLVWVSKGTPDNKDSAADSSDSFAFPGETPEQRAEREEAGAYYCKKAIEIYNSYKNAPRLYRTNEAGEREYLSKKDAKAALNETKTKMDELCS